MCANSNRCELRSNLHDPLLPQASSTLPNLVNRKHKQTIPSALKRDEKFGSIDQTTTGDSLICHLRCSSITNLGNFLYESESCNGKLSIGFSWIDTNLTNYTPPIDSVAAGSRESGCGHSGHRHRGSSHLLSELTPRGRISLSRGIYFGGTLLGQNFLLTMNAIYIFAFLIEFLRLYFNGI